MRIGIYAQPSGSVLGGTDVSIAVLAEALAGMHDVEIIHHGEQMTRDRLAEFSGTSLESVTLRFVPPSTGQHSDSYNPLRRYRETRTADRDLSERYDLFIAFVHNIPPFCHARHGLLLVLFPSEVPLHQLPGASGDLWQRARRAYSRMEWSGRMSTYARIVSISRYTHEWVTRRWQVDSTVVYPPADFPPASRAKDPLILSVGRFTSGGHVKCQLEMVRTFASLPARGWQYVSAGAVADRPADWAYFEGVRQAASRRVDIFISPNIAREAIRDLYGRASIFWHACGLTNVNDDPTLNEHFGISTVEAMGAGAVPVVLNRGGQPEIVQHGTSGFLWNSEQELAQFTTTLMNDRALLEQMSGAARRQAETFSRQRYIDDFVRVVQETTGNERALTSPIEAVAGELVQ
jgi:L-malate glycosyltransferase